MTYSEAIQFLFGLNLFGANFGLENTFRLSARVGNPQAQLRFIHVAGTNGKGSTCAMLESIYRAAGLRVGLFTSPHLVSFRERIQVDRELIPEREVVRLVEELCAPKSSAGVPPASGRRDGCATLFEVVTVMALKYFAEQKCDLVIWETGLGGRLDATNIVTPLASVITNIALDHTQWLGDTLEKIAAEKAGIIKPGVPIVTAEEKPEPLAVIEKNAREKNAPLTKINFREGRRGAVPNQNEFGSPTRQPSPIENLPLSGGHQKLNAALALAAVEVLQKQIPVTDKSIRKGLATVSWPGRLQLVENPDGQKILLDGAHNVAGAETLRATLEKDFPGSRPVFIFGALADKNWPDICRLLAPLAAKVFTVPVASGRTADALALADQFRSANPAAAVTACENLAAALIACKNEPFLVITGSLYLVGEALERLGLSPADGGERGLNEWTSPKIRG